MCTLGNCHFHLQLAVKGTHIYIIVTIPSKLQLDFYYGKVSNSKNAFYELFNFFFFFWLNSRISLTKVHPHMKLGGDIDFGDAQGIGLLKFWYTPYFLENHNKQLWPIHYNRACKFVYLSYQNAWMHETW